MAYFDELLQRAITVRNNRAPASNTADLVGGVLVGIVTALQMLLDDKQDELTFDTAPTADSQNPVTSDGIYQALQAIDLSACEKIVNKVTSINAQSTDVQYPTAKLLYDSLQALSGIYAAIQHTHAIADIINLQTELNARQLVSNLVTAITAQSTDAQYPSAKLLYDQLALKANQATTYTKTEVDTLIGALSTISFAVVQQLPTSDIQTNVIYLVPAAQPGQSNIYNEYIYVNNSWELIGSTAIDLSGYEQTVNKVTTISAQSTDVQYPSARCVWQLIIGINAALTNLNERVTRLESFHYETYYIRGTSTNVGGTETFTIQMVDLLYGTTSNVTFTAEVDVNGAWEVEYKGKKIRSLSSVWLNNATVLTLELTEPMDECNNCQNAVRASVIQSFSAPNALLQNVDARYMFYNCVALTTINLPEATFDKGDCSSMFYGCAVLTTLDLSKATFEEVTTVGDLFRGCAALTTIDLPEATFNKATSCSQMFYGCAVTSLSMPKATFDLVTSVSLMFIGCKVLDIYLPEATFASVANVNQMFHTAKMTALRLPKATFASVTTWNQCLINCTTLATVEVPNTSVALALTATSPNFTFQWSPLTYQSILNIANWIKDFTGHTTQTLKFKTSAWNALTAAEQATIQGILSGKNWTLATA